MHQCMQYILNHFLQVSRCDTCQRNGQKLSEHCTELHPVPVHSTGVHVAIDLIGPLSPTSSSGNWYNIYLLLC